MKNRRTNRAGTGGPMRSSSQDNLGKGRFQMKKPYQRPMGEGYTLGQYKPMTLATGGAGNQVGNTDVTCFRCGKNGHFAD